MNAVIVHRLQKILFCFLFFWSKNALFAKNATVV